MSDTFEILNTKQPLHTINDKRVRIAELIIQSSSNIKSRDISAISSGDLRLLFDIYDAVFFNSWFKNNYKGKMKFSLSRKMTRSAGKTMCPKNIGRIKPEDITIEIRMGVDFFLNYGQLAANNVVCGLRVNNSLEALLLVFEHELCHVIEFLLYHKSSCAGKRFKTMANNLFGHMESCHKLPTDRQIADEMFGYRPGDTVLFNYKDQKLTGIIYNIHKRAAVLVPDRKGHLRDRYGTRYTKYYIPLKLLAKPDQAG